MATATAPREAFQISEAISVKAGTVNADGTVNLHIIRPGIGRGKGKHLYTPEMLAENAGIFGGWRMYVDHLSEEARRALGGLPRSIRDLGGRILESYWDPNVPADPSHGWGEGAVVGKAKPVPLVAELIEHDPELIEASISARATGVKPMNHNGQQVWMVEGIEPTGSVDWVTEAGAGGRVVSLMEALAEDADGLAVLQSLSDEELLDHLRNERPDLLTAAYADDEGDDEKTKLVKKHKKRGLPQAMAEKAANKELAMQQSAREGEEGDDDDVPLTVEALRETFASDEGQALLDELLEERVEARVKEILPDQIEEAMEEERELIRIEAKADADRQIFLRDARDRAHTMIRESKLPTEFQSVLLAKFDLVENRPTPALDVIEEVDDESGTVTKTGMQVLEEAVKDDLDEQRRLLAAAQPTRVSGPTRRLREARDDESEEQRKARELEESKTTGSPLTDKLLVGSGFSSDNLGEVYG